MVKDIVQAKQEGLNQLEYRFPISHFRKNDSKGWFPIMRRRYPPISCMLMIVLKMKYLQREPKTRRRCSIERLTPI
jgi:hypothetical protein